MPTAPAAPRLYFCRDGQTVEGPFPADLVRQMVQRKELSLITSVCVEGTEAWLPFNELPPPALPELSPAAKGCGVIGGIILFLIFGLPLCILLYYVLTSLLNFSLK